MKAKVKKVKKPVVKNLLSNDMKVKSLLSGDTKEVVKTKEMVKKAKKKIK